MARSTQTTRINGRKVRLVTNKAGKISITEAPTEEWLLQAAAVRTLRSMPEYADTEAKVAANTKAGRQSFTLAGDMNGDYRSPKAAVRAKATGIAAGDPDLRLYLPNGQLRLIEYKNAEGKPTASQKIRHPLLATLGHPVALLKVGTEQEASEATVALVRGWLAEVANDNNPARKHLTNL